MFNGRILKELRISAGLTQQELGDMVNVTKVSICGYEKNNRIPNLETLMDLAEVLNTTPNYLLGIDKTITINEDNEEYNVSISKKDIEIIKELKKHFNLYNKLCENPKKVIDNLSKKFD